jgi:predicted phosphodiesterase
MRAWIFSDLHVDANARSPWRLPDPRPKHDVVIIAGDICQGIGRGVQWIADHDLNRNPVLYVPGNHEYYGSDFETELSAGRAAAARLPNIHVLDREEHVIDGVAFLGATLWTDYQLYGTHTAQEAMHRATMVMADHRMIRRGVRLWAPSDAVDEHERSRTWLEQQLCKHGRDSVAITHTAPSLTSISPRYHADILTAAFASNLDHLLDGANVWVHGHTHIGCFHRRGRCRVINNPRGYTGLGEDVWFNPSTRCTIIE